MVSRFDFIIVIIPSNFHVHVKGSILTNFIKKETSLLRIFNFANFLKKYLFIFDIEDIFYNFTIKSVDLHVA